VRSSAGYPGGMSSGAAGGRERFGLETALAAAERDELALWVGDFLASDGSDNEVLAAALALRPHWWVGPLELELADLERLAGPEDDALCAVDDDEWEDDIDSMEDSLDDGWAPPPLLVQYDGGRLLLQDGNHRYEAMVRSGERRGWGIVYFDVEADRDRFVADHGVSDHVPTNG
jgi:hypothetical protein